MDVREYENCLGGTRGNCKSRMILSSSGQCRYEIIKVNVNDLIY
jgi:hypothetical protein